MSIRLYALLFICCLAGLCASHLAAQCSITITVSASPATCLLANGSITVEVAGGVPNYSYSWTDGTVTGSASSISANPFIISNLSAGGYSLTITDGIGCTATTSIAVAEPPVLTLGSTIVDVLCNGAFTGSIDLTVSGGTPPYAYMWTTGTTVPDLTNLSAGTYTVTATDANGCTVTSSATITEPPAITLAVISAHPVCGTANGSINLTVVGGTSPYTYAWSNGAFTQDLTNLVAGNYTVTVTDANNCTETASATLTYNCAAIGDFVWKDLDGDGVQDAGEPGIAGVTVTLAGTTGNGNPITLTTMTGPNGEYLFPNLPAGTYAINFSTPAGYTPTIQDQGGNDANDSDADPLTGMTQSEVLGVGENNLTYDAGFVNSMQVNALATNLSCLGDSTGTIDLTVTGGFPPLSYLWSNGATTQDLAGLPIGSYNVTVTDASGATQTATAAVASFVSIVLTTVANTPCASSSIDLTVSGGTAPYTYQWSTGSITEDLTQLIAATYAVTVTDGNGCTETTSATVTAPAEMFLQTVVTDVSCFGLSNGAVQVIVNGGMPPYISLWSNGTTVQNLINLSAGTYTVTVTDATGCTKTASATVTQPVPIVIQPTVTNVSCFGGNDGMISWNNGVQSMNNLSAGTYTVTATNANGCTGSATVTVTQPSPIILSSTINNLNCTVTNGPSIDLTVTGGRTPYIYLWSNGATTQDLTNLTFGLYTVTVTDANNCTKTTSVTINQPSLPTITPIITYTNCSSATVSLQIAGGTAPYTYAWTSSGTVIFTQFAVIQNSGTYVVIVTDNNGCTATASFVIDLAANSLCGTIIGRVLRDTIANCQTDAEPGLAHWIVQAVGTATYYGITDALGQYHIEVQPGSYTLSTIPPNVLWEPCPLQPTVTVTQPNDTLVADDLLVQKTANCPALTVAIATAQMRRCFSGSYTVDYCNEGTEPAAAAYIVVQLDAYLSVQSATIPYINLGSGQLRFNLGQLDISECGSFKIYVAVSCSATPGQTHCTEAHIYPDGNCLPTNPLWSGASLQVRSECGADSLRFVIKNVGVGPLSEAVDYIVIEDQVMLMRAPVPPLAVGDSVQIAFPANGSTWRVEVEQTAFHPGASQPGLSVEGCSTGTFSTGFVSQFPTDDADPWLDIDCTVNTGSSDPNDKQGFPIGYGPAHYIRPNSDLEYLIRFQNTGTDTAFTVVIVDTLSAWLDPATVHFGPASHPYRAELYGPGILKFHFEHILLPDSNVNEVASHGFVRFQISPRANAPLETLVENQAAIYFDFNDPVLTNTTFHRLGEQFITSGLWQPQVVGATVIVSPNPFDQQARLEVKGVATNTPLQLQVFDLQGNRIQEMHSSTADFLLKKGDWPSGVYLFRISQKGKLVGSGKLMVH